MKKDNRKIDYKMGEFIWSLVSKSGKKQEEFAKELGVSTRSIAFYCSGQRQPKLRKFLQIIKIAGGIKAEDIPFQGYPLFF